MYILGIDPGLAIVGWGIIESLNGRIRPIAYGAITTPAHTDIESRLLIIQNDLEAIKAANELKEKGICCGIVLLEMLKPYDLIAERIADILPETAELILFLEEEIRGGGMGITLSDKLHSFASFNNKKHIIMAVDDNFVKNRQPEEDIWSAAGIDARHIITNIQNNM